MTSVELAVQVQKKATTALLNPDEVTTQLAETAAGEALELVQNKEIPDAMMVDLALFRLKLWLKVEIDEHDKKLADAAIKMANGKDMASGKTTHCVVKNRISEW